MEALLQSDVLIYGLGVAVFLAGGAAYFFRRGRAPRERDIPPDLAPTPETPTVEAPVVAPTKPAGRPLDDKLKATRSGFRQRLDKFFQRQGSGISQSEWDEIEEVLIGSDVGVGTTAEILKKVRERALASSGESVSSLFKVVGEGLFDELPHGEIDLSNLPKPWVISVVGVNGVGKTTTVGKLSSYFQSKGKSVLLGAVDTFRAGAISQLKIWSDRTGSDFVTGREGADPGAVAFDSVSAGKSRGTDIVLLDTAGRLHTKDNLMDELKKVHRVVKKVLPEAPHERWLVLDGTLGQNSVRQAKEFHQALELTGIIVTKLDGTAKGGVLFSIAQDLKLPVRFIGVGESVEDLMVFSPKPFVEAILGR